MAMLSGSPLPPGGRNFCAVAAVAVEVDAEVVTVLLCEPRVQFPFCSEIQSCSLLSQAILY